MHDFPANISDHFLLHSYSTVELSIIELKVSRNICSNYLPHYPRINWSDVKSCSRYREYIDDHLESLPEVSVGCVQAHLASRIVASLASGMVSVMHECCEQLIMKKQTVYEGRFKPNKTT